MNDPRLLRMSSFLVDYPFADRLYPGALDAIGICASWGPTVILSDGDVVFQPRKIQRSGLWEAVEGRVLIYIHKERMLDDVERRYPARHYVMVDDKLRILAAMKRDLGRAPDDRLPAPGTLRARSAQPRALSAGRPDDRAHRRSARLRSCRIPRVSKHCARATGDDMNANTATARSRPEPLARQHHARAADERHARAATSTSSRSPG